MKTIEKGSKRETKMALGSKRGGGHRGRPYGMMLLLAFGAAVLGVMVLHKLRERRIFTLLIRDKDQDLMALHVLLQMERESSQELKRKIDELKAKTYSLRTQKMELSTKFASMQSVSFSLKEEQRALESTVEEKQNELNMLRQRETNSSEEDSQIAALRELLKQKEAEIEEMKGLLEKSSKVWSVSTDDPSKPPVDLTLSVVSVKGSIQGSEEPDVNFKDKQSERSADQNDNKVLLDGEGGDSKNVSEGRQIKEIQEGQMEKGLDGEAFGGSNAGEVNTEDTQQREEVLADEQSNIVEDSQGFIKQGEGNTNKTGVTGSDLNDEVVNTVGEGDNAVAAEGAEQRIKLENPKSGDGRRLGKISKDGLKLKKLGRSRVVIGSRVRGNHGHKSTRTKRKIVSENGEKGQQLSSKSAATQQNSGNGDNTSTNEVIREQKRTDYEADVATRNDE